MPARRRIDPIGGRSAVAAWREGDRTPGVVATAVRFSLEELASRAPGGAIEVRVPPYGAIQCGAGGRHTRGTPPNVVEADPETWLRLATGESSWADVLGTAGVSASGAHADLSPWLPVLLEGGE